MVVDNAGVVKDLPVDNNVPDASYQRTVPLIGVAVNSAVPPAQMVVDWFGEAASRGNTLRPTMEKDEAQAPLVTLTK